MKPNHYIELVLSATSPSSTAGHLQSMTLSSMHKLATRLISSIFFIAMYSFESMNAQCTEVPSWSIIHETCPGSNDGSICCNENGNPPSACSLNPFPSESSFSNGCFHGVPPGDYTVTSTYPGCPPIETGILTVYEDTNATMVITITDLIDDTCSLGIGGACLNVVGGGSQLNFLWDNDALFIPPYIDTLPCTNNLAEGDYFAAVTYKNFYPDQTITTCRNFILVSISTTSFNVSAIAHDATNINPCDGSIDVDLSNAILPAIISWTGSSSDSITVSSGNNYTITGLCAGSYSISVNDVTSCEPVVISGLSITMYYDDFMRAELNDLNSNSIFENGQNVMDQIHLWPNPIYYDLEAIIPENSTRVFITDMTGRALYEERVYYPNQQFDLSKLGKGVYVFNVELEDGNVVSKRIVKS